MDILALLGEAICNTSTGSFAGCGNLTEVANGTINNGWYKSSTPLTLAIMWDNDMKVIDKIIGFGAGVEMKDPEGFTPLGMASHEDRPEITERLLGHYNVDPNVKMTNYTMLVI